MSEPTLETVFARNPQLLRRYVVKKGQQTLLRLGIAIVFGLQLVSCLADGTSNGVSNGTAGTADSNDGTGDSDGGIDSAAGDGASDGTDGTGDSNGGTDTPAEEDDGRFTVSAQLASDVNRQAPGTIGIVTWSVSKGVVTEAHIEFGLDTTYGMVAPVDLEETDFRTLLLGMKPNKEYHFRVVATIDATTYASGDYQVETGPTTNLVTLSQFDVANAAARERGFIVTELYQSEQGGIVFIIDPDGEIVWWFESAIDSLDRARMSADGKNMWMVRSGLSGGSLQRVTMDTLDAESYDVGASHDITPVEGETMAYLDYSESDCDSIYTIDPSGKTKEVFESQGVVGSQECHSNALRYSTAEDVYTFSDHKQDVLVINRTGGVEWRLTELVGSNSSWGGSQHGHQLLDNSIVIFANGQKASAIEYDLDDGKVIWRYDEDVTVNNLGDVQRLPGGNTLVTYSTAGVIKEINAGGDVVLTIKTGSSIGYSVWRESLYGLPPDILQ